MYLLNRIAPKFMLVSGCSFLLMKRKVFMSEDPIIQEIIRGEYENRIRRYSPPEKIFDVFATIRQNGQLYMNLHDLLKAICFYNFSVSVNLILHRTKNKLKGIYLKQFYSWWAKRINSNFMIILSW